MQSQDHPSLQTWFTTRRNPIETRAEARPSDIHGIGVFARHDIPRGTTWWHARSQDVLLITRAQHETLQASMQSDSIKAFMDTIVFYAYYLAGEDVLVLCLDNARYVNHSGTPNSGPGDDRNPFRSIALRDIHAGEEIVENYKGYSRCPWAIMYRAFLEHD
jgi:hypothetical protein